MEQAGISQDRQKRLNNQLLKAVKTGDMDGVRVALLDQGADVNAKGVCGVTPLHWAAWCGYKEVIGVLLKAGAEVDAKDKYGQTALHYAAAQGNNGVVELLQTAKKRFKTNA